MAMNRKHSVSDLVFPTASRVRRYQARLLWIFLLSVFACDSTDSDVQIVPLQIGNSWTYVNTQLDIDGNIRHDTITYNIITKEHVISDGRETTVFVETSSYNAGLQRLWTNGAKGYYRVGMRALDDSIIHPKSLFYKYPVSVGEVWVYQVYDLISANPTQPLDSIYWTCTSVDTIVSTPLGMMKAISYRTTKDTSTTTRVVVPGIGLVFFQSSLMESKLIACDLN